MLRLRWVQTCTPGRWKVTNIENTKAIIIHMSEYSDLRGTLDYINKVFCKDIK